jgi:predicted exporter
LQRLVEKELLSSFDRASHYLPSLTTQQARLASLPTASELKFRLTAALKGLPVQPAVFDPFLTDVETARTKPLLQRSDLQGTSMAMAIDAMLLQQGEHWSSLIPLTAPENGNIDVAQVQAALDQAQVNNTLFVDMKAESNRLYSGYMQEAILLSLTGIVAIILLLLFVLRSPLRVMAVIVPLVAAVLTVMAGLALFGQQLIILHLIGLLLIVAIGSNYALFFNPVIKQGVPDISPRTYASLVFANVATVLGFGLLAFSSVPVLQAMGVTVAPGVILALVFSAVFARSKG